MGNWIVDAQDKAADSVLSILKLPLDSDMIGVDGYFDPWAIFPSIYGSYSSEFDECAIAVLRELKDPKYDERGRTDLGAYMFREMLCVLDLCDYGTSPRVCFATAPFKAIIPDLIEKWLAYYLAQWETPLATKGEAE